jgi:hypothetical protein
MDIGQGTSRRDKMNLTKREVQTILNLLDYAVDNGYFKTSDPDEEKQLGEAADDLHTIRMQLYAESDKLNTPPTTEILPSWVGKRFLRLFGLSWMVSNFMGRILESDVGKRIYLKTNYPFAGDFLQVESDEQFKARKEKHDPRTA